MRNLALFLTLSLLAAVSCSKEFDDSRIWDKLNDHESRIEYLETLCGQMNTNIKALQTTVSALQDKDYVTNVAPITSGGKEVGYTITFLKSGSVTIYHGKDGEKGEQGEAGVDGQTPIIGIKQDTDGIYYWTLNGGWLLSDGQKVKAVGTDGAKGETGKDGVTPQLKIEDGKWLISYDKGVSWEEVGQVTGDQGPQGEQGNPGVNGDSMFTDINYSNNDYVLFVLSNGQQFKIPTWSAFEALQEHCRQMNQNIAGLKSIVTALQNNDYISSITPIYEGVNEIGYIINFTKSGKVTIYHGKGGKTPVIGVAKDTDGVYYWTVDGSWLVDETGAKIPTTGKDGAQGEQGAQGNTGATGSQGPQGVSGITPQLKIEDGRWLVSYDNGATWTDIGQATGVQGEAGKDGDSFFQSVTQDEENVYLTLADGTKFSVPKTPLEAAVLTLANTTGFTATFNGTVIRSSLDLKVTVYYSTTPDLTVYKNKGKVSVTEFVGDSFILKLSGLGAETTYYYFTEVISNGTVKYSTVNTFRTGKADSYVDWEEGDHVGGEI